MPGFGKVAERDFILQSSVARFSSLGGALQHSNARLTNDHRSATSVRLLLVDIALQRAPPRKEYARSPLSCLFSLLSTTVQFVVDLLNYDIESFDTVDHGLQRW